MMVSRQVLDYLNKLSVGDHVVLFYESLEMKHRVLFTFLREGLERGEAAVYVTGEETPEQIRRGMKDFGMDVEKYELDGSLRIPNYDPWYMRRGAVNLIPEIMENWNEVIQHAKMSGKKGVRVTSDVSFQFIQRDKTQELHKYEASIGRTLKVPMIAICVYNAEQATPIQNGQFFTGLLKAHGHAIFPGIALNLLV